MSGTIEFTTTHYIRDATGNIMATYVNTKIQELHIYGSARLGTYKIPYEPDPKDNTKQIQVDDFHKLILGRRSYELSNHLGNVLAVISDKKILLDSIFQADIVSANDYYPFGMTIESRSFVSEKYRFGFNGKENDKDFGEGHVDFGARVYDSKTGRWFATDPLQAKYPYLSSYNFVANSPIMFIDIDGREIIWPVVTSTNPFQKAVQKTTIHRMKRTIEWMLQDHPEFAKIYKILDESDKKYRIDLLFDKDIANYFNKNKFAGGFVASSADDLSASHQVQEDGGEDMNDLEKLEHYYSLNKLNIGTIYLNPNLGGSFTKTAIMIMEEFVHAFQYHYLVDIQKIDLLEAKEIMKNKKLYAEFQAKEIVGRMLLDRQMEVIKNPRFNASQSDLTAYESGYLSKKKQRRNRKEKYQRYLDNIENEGGYGHYNTRESGTTYENDSGLWDEIFDEGQ